MSDFADQYTMTTRDQVTGEVFQEETDIKGGLYALSGGLAVDILPNLYIGGTVNFLSGKQDSSVSFDYQSQSTQINEWYQMTNTFSGFNFELGFIWRPSRMISVGSRIRTPYTLYYNNVQYDDYAGNARELVGERKLELPMTFSTGIALALNKNFTFAFDWVQRPWKKAKVHRILQENDNRIHVSMDQVFANANSFHMGIEYMTRVAGLILPWRIGFFNHPEQLFEYNRQQPDNKGDQISSHFLTTGFGVWSKIFRFDISLTYKFYQYQRDFGIPDSPFDYKISKFRFLMGFEYLF
jgi:hypothetical protein